MEQRPKKSVRRDEGHGNAQMRFLLAAVRPPAKKF